VAELVDARDLKFLPATENAQHSVKTLAERPTETGGNPGDLYNSAEQLRQIAADARLEAKIADLETAGYRIVDSVSADGGVAYIDYQTGEAIGIVADGDELPGNWVHIDDLRLTKMQEAPP
jgi:hypothetical protein